jgi:hypothetical protein
MQHNRIPLMNPYSMAMLAWQASLVFSVRSLGLWMAPGEAPARLIGYALEKQRAFTAGGLAAGRAALAGAEPAGVVQAALGPARRRVRANARKLTGA